MDWLNNTNNQLAAALKWLSNGALATMLPEGSKIQFKNGSGEAITGTVGKNGQVIGENGEIYKDVDMDSFGNWHTKETPEEALENAKTPEPETSGNINSLPGSTRLTVDEVKRL